MKRNMNKILIFVLIIMMMTIFVGCASQVIESPEDAIKNAYGDKQFRISFDSTSLESPLSDVFYTANNMPMLPTPKKVGFVFAGWYFDASFTEPCDVSRGDLLWKMRDLTLYPKWEEEQIVNNGTYEIEYNAKIIEDSIAKGPLVDKYGYQKFPEDIIASETYIEKNDKGTFLRIQYDNRVRGPVLGGDGADENNFSKMTYTVIDLDNRIDKSLSILDRTNNVQTIYYNIDGLKLTDTITLYIEYYNWKKELNEDDRKDAKASYRVEFKVTKFIGFDQSFVNPEGRLDDGIYVVPTHYTGLDKTQSMLDMFNPVYAYIEVHGGHYTLYKPLNAYNNDFPEVTPEQYPLRTSGYAREFACMYINKDKKISKIIEEDKSGKYYLPEEIGANKYIPLTYEFHADTGRYYYSVDLGNTLDNDLVFIGGSSGAMEQMFSFPFDYRRLTLDYNSMVRIVDWDYTQLSGDEYIFKEKAAIYPGSAADFANTSTAYDIYKSYRQAINMTNVFFTNTSGNIKVYDTKMVITPLSSYPMGSRYRYANFDISYSAYGYDPRNDGELLARELTFNTNASYKHSNSFVNNKRVGKTFNIGDVVSLPKIYKDKVIDDRLGFEYQAYAVDSNLNVDFNNKISVANTFQFSRNIAVLFTSKSVHNRTTLVYIVEKQDPSIKIIDNDESIVWTKNANGIYQANKRIAIGSSGEPITIPEITYNYYGTDYSMRNLKKYDDDEIPYTDYTRVSVWENNHGKYKSVLMMPGANVDFIMHTDKIRVLVQLTNPFGEFEAIELEYVGMQASEYNIKVNDKIVSSGDTKYKGEIRNKISYQMYETFNIIDSLDINNIPSKFVLDIKKNDSVTSEDLLFDSAIIYMQNDTVTVNNISDIWAVISGAKYALIHMYYVDSYGDNVMYKAQYNFKINSHTLDNYYFINDERTIFTGDSKEFRNPLITSSDFISLGNGMFNIYLKNGYNYEWLTKQDINYYDDGYRASVEFKKNGTYLLTWKYEFYKDENGIYVFDANKIDDQTEMLMLNVCQVVEVVDKDAEIEVTYVTDINHPFDKTSKELAGYAFSEDSKYQYATIKVTNAYNTFALTRKSFVTFDSSDIRVKDKLFSWRTKDGEIAVYPGYMLQGLNVKIGTTSPVIYADWDSGITIDVFSDNYGVIKKESTTYLQKDTINHRDYQLAFSSLSVNVPDGYVIYGWRASKAIFTEKVVINGVEKTVPSNFHKGMQGSIVFDEKIDFTAVLKKSAYVTYEAYDETISSTTKFKKPLDTNYGVFIGDRFNDIISDAKLKELSKVSVENKTFKYWSVYDYEQDKYVKVDLNTWVLEAKYANNYGRITLRAVFG